VNIYVPFAIAFQNVVEICAIALQTVWNLCVIAFQNVVEICAIALHTV
jgi:hypothetical protein